MVKKTQLMYGVFLLFTSFSFSQLTNTNIIAEIKVNTQDEFITVDATVKSKVETINSLRYVFYLIQKVHNSDEIIKKEQARRFVLETYEEKQLKTIKINKNSKDKITTILLIYDANNKLVAKDRVVVLNDDETKTKQNIIPKEEDYTGFKGIVTKSTKTKAGHDFYVMFYSNYSLKQINGKQTVQVIEKISLGRNTTIEIVIGNIVVHQFFVRPTLDFLKTQAELSIKRVTRYFSNLEKQKLYITRY